MHVAAYRGHFFRALDIVNGNRFVHKLENTLQVRDRIDDCVHKIGQVHKRLPETCGVVGHGKYRTEREHTAERQKSDRVNSRLNSYADNIGGRPDKVREADRAYPAFAIGSGKAVVNFLVFLLADEHLRYLRADDVLMLIGGKVGAFVRYRLPSLALTVLDEEHYPEVYRQSAERYQSKLPADDKHKHRNKKKIKYFQHEVYKSVRHKVGYGVYVVDYSRKYFSVRTAVVEIERKQLHMLEQVASDIVDDILSGLGHKLCALFSERDAHDDTSKHSRAAEQQHWDILFTVHVVVDCILDDDRREQSDNCRKRT